MQKGGRFSSLRAPTTPVTPAPLACSAVHLSSVNLIIAAPDTGEAEMKPGRETCYRPKFCLFLLHLPAITHRYGFYSENCDTSAKKTFLFPHRPFRIKSPVPPRRFLLSIFFFPLFLRSSSSSLPPLSDKGTAGD